MTGQIKETTNETMRDIFKELSNRLQGGDHEVEMAINDLHSIVHRASELAKRLEEQGEHELEGWVQAKITKSADYINAVYDKYMFATKDSYHSNNDTL